MNSLGIALIDDKCLLADKLQPDNDISCKLLTG